MAKRTVQCTHCGADYITSRTDSRFCGRRCSYQARLGRPHKRQCETCGTDISDRHYNAKFCPPCYEVRPQAIHETSRKAKRPWYTECKGCGVTFEQHRQQQFCSSRCAGIYNRAKQIGHFPKACRACGDEFVAQDKRRQTCSVACHMWRLKNPDRMRVMARECRICETPFVARNGNQYCCSSECNRTARSSRRRALEANAFIEDVSRVAIGTRDKWICRLCGKRVNKRLKFPDPMSQSLDHIVPIALGGEHSRANTQIAHLVCNISKGSRLRDPQQLALIG